MCHAIKRIFKSYKTTHLYAVYKKPTHSIKTNRLKVKSWEGFPDGAVVKNPPASAGDTGLSPGPGRSHMPQSN